MRGQSVKSFLSPGGSSKGVEIEKVFNWFLSGGRRRLVTTVQRDPAVDYGMARLGLFGGGGGMSSESGSAGCSRFWPCTAWVQRSTYSRRITLVTGSRMLWHTAGEGNNVPTNTQTQEKGRELFWTCLRSRVIRHAGSAATGNVRNLSNHPGFF